MYKFGDALKKHRGDATLDLFVTPNASSTLFPSGYNEWRKRIEIRVCSSAKDNKANKEVIKTIADYFNKSEKQISIISGEKKREKTILIKGTSADNIAKILKESLDGL